MKLNRAALPLLVLTIGCGGDTSTTGPSGTQDGLSFPTVVPVGTTCGSGASAVYFIWGLSNNVRDPQARPLEAVVPVGQSLRLSLEFAGCGGETEDSWTSTNPAVGDLTPDPEMNYISVTRFTARAVGVTEVFADFRGPDRNMHRTYPAYCPASIYGCAPPRTPFTLVRVVAE
jgi:hypothetical protein